MSSIEKIYHYCLICKSTGKIDGGYDNENPVGDIDCPECDGQGKTLWGYIEKE